METYVTNKNGKKLFCRVIGEGDPLLLIHGAVVDADFFDELAQILSKKYSVIVYDRPGYCRSEKENEFSFASQADDAAEILKHFSDRPAVVLGCSMGAIIGMNLLARYPGMVARLILHEPPLLAFPNITVREEQDALDRAGVLVESQKYKKALLEFLMLTNGGNDERAKPYSMEKIDVQMKNGVYCMEREFLPMIHAVESDYLIEELEKFRERILCTCGDSSRSGYAAKAARLLAEKLHCGCFYVAGGHNAVRDLPVEYAAVLCGLLTLGR